MSEKEPPKSALVACSRLVEFAGAEITALEMAKTLEQLGYKVQLAALEIGSPLKETLEQAAINYINLQDTKILNKSFDLVWIFHNIAAYHVFINANIKTNFAIYTSLSHFEPIESPPLTHLSFSAYSVHSKENYDFFIDKYPELKNKVQILQNSAPIAFFNQFNKKKSFENQTLKNIALISNHPPSEVLSLIPLLEKNNITIDLFGLTGKTQLIDANIIASYDAVITIGKSVQYCLASGIPVFCYDHFGGPGWINIQNFDLAREYNFSGRCCRTQYSTEDLLSQLQTGYSPALAQLNPLHDKAKLHFDAFKNIKLVLNAAEKQVFSMSLTNTDKNVLFTASDLFLNNRKNFIQCNTHLKNLHEHLENIYNLKSWKILTCLRFVCKVQQVVYTKTMVQIKKIITILRQHYYHRGIK
jgi:O-antigen biosynthesis protein